MPKVKLKEVGTEEIAAGEEFDLVKQWIELNMDVLVDYWNGDIEYTEDALNAIKPVGDL